MILHYLAFVVLTWLAIAKSQNVDPNGTGEGSPASEHVTCFTSGTMDYSQIILAPAYLRDKATFGEHRHCSLTKSVEKDLACFDTARVTFANNVDHPTKTACTDAANAVEAIIAKCCPGCTSSSLPRGSLGAYENDQYRVHIAPRAEHCEEDETIFSGAEGCVLSWLPLAMGLLLAFVLNTIW